MMEQLQPLDSDRGWYEYMRHYERIGGDYTRIGFILGIPGGARSADSRHLLFLVDGHEADAVDNRNDDRGSI